MRRSELRCPASCLAVALAVSAASANVYPVVDFSPATSCLPVEQQANVSNRTLQYSDASIHPVRIPYQGWASAQIMSQLAYILLKETMGYSTVLFNTTTASDNQAVNYVAGCLDPDDPSCADVDLLRPAVHFTVETWEGGRQRASELPDGLRPDLVSVLSYTVFDQWYIWQRTIDAGLHESPPLSLDYYRTYDARIFHPQHGFDTWPTLLSRLPDGIVSRCSSLGGGSRLGDRNTALYTSVTNDTHVACERDRVWISPACRGPDNATACVPLLLPYNFDQAMQLAFFLDMPLAIVQAFGGGYVDAVKRTNILFAWWWPSDELPKDELGRFPVMVTLPAPNVQEQANGIFKTGFAQFKPLNFEWRLLRDVDRLVHYFTSVMTLMDKDWLELMPESRILKDSGMSDADSSFAVACGWIRRNEARWRQWIPAVCPAGFTVDNSLKNCEVCPAGSYCEGGGSLATPCPSGSFFCPAGSSSPQICPLGWTVPDSAVPASSSANCSECAAGYMYVEVLSDVHCVSSPAVIAGYSLGTACVCAVLALLVLMALALRDRKAPADDAGKGAYEERMLRAAVKEARARLRLRNRDGFHLSSESPPSLWLAPWRAVWHVMSWVLASAARLVGGPKAVEWLGDWAKPPPRTWKMLPRSQAEAAARLLVLREEVDVHVFDSLVVFLAGSDDDIAPKQFGVPFANGTANVLVKLGKNSPHALVSDHSTKGPMDVKNLVRKTDTGPGLSEVEHCPPETPNEVNPAVCTAQYNNLCNWMVELSRDLLSPRLSTSGGRRASFWTEGKGAGSPAEGGEGEGGLVGILQRAAQKAGDARRSSFRACPDPRAPGPAQMSPVQRKRRLSTVVPILDNVDSICYRMAGQAADEDNWRFRYFVQTVCRSRLWKYHGGALFGALQRVVNHFLEVTAAACDRRFESIEKDPAGMDLILSRWIVDESASRERDNLLSIIEAAHKSVASRGGPPPTRRSSINPTKPAAHLGKILRQDDELVGAIRVSAIDLLEACLPSASSGTQIRAAAFKATKCSMEIMWAKRSLPIPGAESAAGDNHEPSMRPPAVPGKDRDLSKNRDLPPSLAAAQGIASRPESHPGTSGGVHPCRLEPAVTTAGASTQGDEDPSGDCQRFGEDEEIFLLQLKRRARLLSRPFHKKVLEEVWKHSTPDEFLTLEDSSDNSGSDGAQPAPEARSPAILPKALKAISAEVRRSFRKSAAGKGARGRGFATRMVKCVFKGRAGKEYVSLVEVIFAPPKSLSRMREKLKEYDRPDADWPLSANILDPIRMSIVCQGPKEVLEVVGWFLEEARHSPSAMPTSPKAPSSPSSRADKWSSGEAPRGPPPRVFPCSSYETTAEEEVELPQQAVPRAAESHAEASIAGAGSRSPGARHMVGLPPPRSPAMGAPILDSMLQVQLVDNRFALPREEILDGYRDVKLSVLFTEPSCGLSIIGEIQIHDREMHKIKTQMHKLYKVTRAKSADLVR